MQQQQQFAGGSPMDVKAAFMKWLQEEMPQALSSVQSSAAGSPRPGAAAAAGPGGLFAMQEEVLQGLTSSECYHHLLVFKMGWVKKEARNREHMQLLACVMPCSKLVLAVLYCG
jgi:hypothetical protein